jgi:hypothetical protein
MKEPFNCPHCGELISDHDESKDEKIKRLQENFYDFLREFVPDFDKETVREFYDYWSEPNRSKTKIKYQLERTWDTKRRLQRWKRNNFNNDTNRTNNRKGFASDTTRRAIEQVQNGFTE